MADLSVRNLTIRRSGRCLVDDVSFDLRQGELVVLLGPNGAGKSLTLKGALGLVPSQGMVKLSGNLLTSLTPATRARSMAYLPQISPLAWPARVRDIVALGRFAHGAAPSRLKPADEDAVSGAMADCGLAGFEDRAVTTLSGGELARVHCARAFAARAPLLLADEPVAALDPAQAYRIMDMLRARAAGGTGVLAVLHDIGLAARYADRVILMQSGRLIADGSVEDVLTEKALASLYGIRAEIDGRNVHIVGPL